MPVTPISRNKGGKTPQSIADHLKDLPPEVLKQLSTSYVKGRDQHLEADIFEKFQKTLKQMEVEAVSLDDLLVDFFRTYSYTISRNALSAHMNRLVKKGLVARPNYRQFKLPAPQTDQ